MKILLPFLLLMGSLALTQEQQNVVLLDHWTDSTVAPSPGGVRFNEVQGFVFGGNMYAVMGSNNGAHLFQIQNKSLRFIDFVPGKYQAITAENRDYAVYDHYLYASCDEGSSSLQIMDLAYLPDSVTLIYDSNSLFSTAHTLCIDTLNARLYACGTNSAAMKIADLSNPENPVLITDFTSVSYVHDSHVVNDTAFLNCGYDGLRIYDFSGPVPMLLGQLDFYANQGYNHSGYLADSRKQYAFTDETEGTRIKLCYLNNYADIKVDQEFGTRDFANQVPHEIVLLENLLFCAYYNEGLRIYDLANAPIREIGAYDTYPVTSTFTMAGAWGVSIFENENLILVSDRHNGLFLFYFPITEIESGTASGTYITGTPFLDGNRMLIPRSYLNADALRFSITTAAGAVVYHQENYLNWLNIPLNLAGGTYVYAIYDDTETLLESGKFVLGD